MKSFTKILALGAIAASLAGGAVTSSAEAKGFKGGGHGFGHTFGGHRFHGHGFKFNFGHNDCWRYGKWICAPRGY